MSEITERTNIISIAEVPAQDLHASMVNLQEMSSYQPLSIALTNIGSYIPSDVASAIQLTCSLSFTPSEKSIKSPNTLRALFKEGFSVTLSKMEAKGVNPVVARKATLINTLKNMDFKIKKVDSINSGLMSVLQAKDMNTLNTEIKAVMRKLEVAHTEVFAANIATACAIASNNIGFREVEIKPVEGTLLVIGRNNLGQRIISEISLDSKTNQVNANTETIGITDGSCSAIINSFGEELRKLKIKIGNEKITFTGGVCQMPYAKIIDKHDKESKKLKELERTRKMNFNKRIKT